MSTYMHTRSKSSKESDSCRPTVSKLSGISKYYNRSLPGPRKPTQGSEGFHGRCCIQPSLPDRIRPVTGNSKSPKQICKPLLSVSKNTESSQKPRKDNIGTFDPSQAPPLQVVSGHALLKGKEQLTAKFEDFTKTIIHLATTHRPLGVRSLEELLTQEIRNTFGSAINDPNFTQSFIQATRRLLESLVSVFEEGKVNPQLLRGQTITSRKYLLKASSGTCICYRDRYLKELVMNMLQGMCSNEIQHDSGSEKTHMVSDASRERINALRNLMRVEAGIEPENFQRLEEELAEMQKALKNKQQEILSAAKQVDETICKHLLSQDESDVCIPKSARDTLKKYWHCNKKCSTTDKDTDCSDGENCSSECCQKMLTSKSSTVSHSKEKIMNDLRLSTELKKQNHNTDISNVVLEKHNSLLTVKPQHEKLVEDEIQIVKKKVKLLKSQQNNISIKPTLTDPFSSSSESEIEDGESCDIEEEEDTRMFLEALVADCNKDLHFLNKRINNEKVLEIIEESGYNSEITEEETSIYLEALKNNVLNREIIGEKYNVTQSANSRCQVTENCLEEGLTLPSASPVCGKTPTTVCHAALVFGPQNKLKHEKCPPNKEKIALKTVNSKWWFQETLEASEIIKQVNQAYDYFKGITDDVFNANKIKSLKEEDCTLKEDPTFYPEENNFDFTIEELAHILLEVSKKVSLISEYLQNSESNTDCLKNSHIFYTLKTLGDYLNSMQVQHIEHNSYSFIDQHNLSMLGKGVSNTFLLLSDTLIHAPSCLKNERFSILAPPVSLRKTLAFLASSDYFRNYFIAALLRRKTSNLYLEKSGECFCSETKKNIILEPSVKRNDLEQIHCSIVQETSSNEIGPVTTDFSLATPSPLKMTSYRRDKKVPEDIYINLSKFDHYLGLTATVMTIQNVSDMFLFLSAVLNDVPDRVKSEKIISLNPPSTLLGALDILYSADDEIPATDVEKKVSLASLTIQNASDFFLTLSKIFQDAPERIKKSAVRDLSDPPRSLLKAIGLLTSLSHNSILESVSQEETNQEVSVQFTQNAESQEKYFDAVDSLTSLKR